MRPFSEWPHFRLAYISPGPKSQSSTQALVCWSVFGEGLTALVPGNTYSCAFKLFGG